VVWITGASSGIGHAVALELARRGFRIAATARRADALAQLADMSAGRIMSFPGDVTDKERMRAIVGEIEANHGPITLAFLNAGLYLPAERQGFAADIVMRTVGMNIGGTVFSLAPVLKAMEARGRGQIVFNGSLAGYAGLPGSLAYGASKAALIYMAETLRLTHAPLGLTIQIVNPGFVRTPMTAHEKTFSMPLLMEADAAARRICDGFERGGFEIAFPWQLAALFKAACLLPYEAFFAVLGAALAKARRQRA